MPEPGGQQQGQVPVPRPLEGLFRQQRQMQRAGPRYRERLRSAWPCLDCYDENETNVGMVSCAWRLCI